jgi:hypothetical protein
VLSHAQRAFADGWGLALAAVAATRLVEEHTPVAPARIALHGLESDALELQARCSELARRYDDDAAEELRVHAIGRRDRAGELALPWFRAATGPAEAWAFLAMAEAGEVAAWSALAARSRRGDGVRDLAAWGCELQERHLRLALDGVVAIGSRA